LADKYGVDKSRVIVDYSRPEAVPATAANPYAKMSDDEVLSELRKKGLLK